MTPSVDRSQWNLQKIEVLSVLQMKIPQLRDLSNLLKVMQEVYIISILLPVF